MSVLHQFVIVQDGDPFLVIFHFFAHVGASATNELFDRYFGAVVVLEDQILQELLVRVLEEKQVDLLMRRFDLLAGDLVADLDFSWLDGELWLLEGI